MKTLNRTLLFLASFIFIANAYAQKVDLDKKTGLVTVDGKESFKLISKNSVLGQSDYSLQNLGGEELAYCKVKGEDYYDSQTGMKMRHVFYTITFSRSGNYCDLDDKNSLSMMKSLAKSIAGANLVVDGQISPAAERNFIVMHKGVFFNDPNKPEGEKVVVNINTNKDEKAAPAAEIQIKDNNIFNHSEKIGMFKRSDEGNMTSLSIYNSDGSKIAVATRPLSSNDNDWSVTLLNNNKQITLLYDAVDPLGKLFKYLVEKGYFN